jgi:poly(3-hydroxybutyrate) depolymerase
MVGRVGLMLIVAGALLGACTSWGRSVAGTGAAGTGTAVGVAIAMGEAGMAGTGPTGADAGAGSAGLPGAAKSDGCGRDPQQPLMTQVRYSIMVTAAPAGYVARELYAWLPDAYDQDRAYPTIFVAPGCGANGDNAIQVSTATRGDAIIIGLQRSPQSSNPGCFMTESATSPEIAYFDEVVAQVEARFCVDENHLFMEGFDSGSWLTNLIGCARGNLLKGQGNAAGCAPPLPTCTGPIAMMGVTNDPDPFNSFQCGTDNRDRIAALNGCSTTTTPYDAGPNVMAAKGGVLDCTQLTGCMPGKPVVWCRTTNLGHNDGSITGLSTYGFWRFWRALP